MKTLNLKRTQLGTKGFNRQSATPHDYEHFIEEDTLIKIEGELPILYKELDIDSRDLKYACLNVKYPRNHRNGGIAMRAAHIGYKVRNGIKDNHCNKTATSYKFPHLHDIFIKYAQLASIEYRTNFPELYESHMASLKRNEKSISDEYIIQGTPFTSGIINKNMPLKYHFDRGNIPGNMSAMITLKQDMVGGYLSLPELGIGLKIANNSLLLFDGQSLIHGVTHMNLQNKNAFRYSTVFYSLQQMWKCLPIKEELKWIQDKEGKI